MAGKSKRTTAPTPLEFPWSSGQPVRQPTATSPMAASVPPPTAQPVPAIPSMFAPGVWLAPRSQQSMATSSSPPHHVGSPEYINKVWPVRQLKAIGGDRPLKVDAQYNLHFQPKILMRMIHKHGD